MPTDGFLDLYLRYTEKQEAPELFHLWTGITILAAAMGRKCYVNKGFYRLYPNIFCILVAGAARCRKSTAIFMGKALLDSATEGGPNKVKIIGSKITPEKFVHDIAEAATRDEEGNINAPTIFVHSSELSVLLTKQSYGEPLIHILTDLFDCPDKWTYRTKNKGEASLHNVFICILAATTPDGIAQGISQAAMQEGFASRVIFVYQEDTPRRNALPELTADELRVYGELRDMLAARAYLNGEFALTTDAVSWYKRWYLDYMDNLPTDLRLEGMYGRKHDHVLRLGMIFAASFNERIIDTHHLEAAKMTLEAVEAHASGAFAQMGGDELTPHIARARHYMRRFGRLTYSELLKKMYPCNAAIFKIILETLIVAGEVDRDPQNPKVLVWKG